MKKLMFLLIFIMTSSAFALNIACPTLSDYSVNGILWDFYLEEPIIAPYNDPVPLAWGGHDSIIVLPHKYDPIKNTEEGSPHTFFTNMHIAFSNVSATFLQDKIKLTCKGTYSAIETILGLLCFNKNGNLTAELLLPYDKYKNCTPVDNFSFDCYTRT